MKEIKLTEYEDMMDESKYGRLATRLKSEANAFSPERDKDYNLPEIMRWAAINKKSCLGSGLIIKQDCLLWSYIIVDELIFYLKKWDSKFYHATYSLQENNNRQLFLYD